MNEQIIGKSKNPIIKLGKRERKIIKYLHPFKGHWNLGERLKDIIEACEGTRLSHYSLKDRKKLEAYYLSSLKSLIRKGLVFKYKKVEETELYTVIYCPEPKPELDHVEKRKITLFSLNEDLADKLVTEG